MKWIPATIFLLRRWSLVTNMSVPATAAQASWMASGARIARRISENRGAARRSNGKTVAADGLFVAAHQGRISLFREFDEKFAERERRRQQFVAALEHPAAQRCDPVRLCAAFHQIHEKVRVLEDLAYLYVPLSRST